MTFPEIICLWKLQTKIGSDYTVYQQVLCLLLYFCSFSKNLATSIPVNLLFCIKADRASSQGLNQMLSIDLDMIHVWVQLQ